DDELVLEEALDHALVQRLRDGRVLQVVVVQVIPEEMRGAVGLRREELAVAVLLYAFQIALLRPVARGREQRLHEEDARHVHARDVPAVDPVFAFYNFSMKWRSLRIHVPALDAEAVLEALDRGRLRLVRVLLRAAERLGV